MAEGRHGAACGVVRPGCWQIAGNVSAAPTRHRSTAAATVGSPAVAIQDRLDPRHVPVGTEVADVIEELVQLERGAALLIARVGGPFVVVGLEQLSGQAVRASALQATGYGSR